MLLDLVQIEHFVVPDATAAFVFEESVGTALASGWTRVVPDLFLDFGHQRYGQAHSLSSANTAYAMDVVLLFVR